jgi:hypothetical protein
MLASEVPRFCQPYSSTVHIQISVELCSQDWCTCLVSRCRTGFLKCGTC